MHLRKKLVLSILVIFSVNILFCQTVGTFADNRNLPGSNVYSRVFVFYFPVSKGFQLYVNEETTKLFTVDISIKKNDILAEPFTPPIFDTDFNIKIINIPKNAEGKISSQISLRCNKKVVYKNIILTVYKDGKLLILRGSIQNLYINDISDNEYFKKRSKWQYPIYFDLRFLTE